MVNLRPELGEKYSEQDLSRVFGLFCLGRCQSNRSINYRNGECVYTFAILNDGSYELVEKGYNWGDKVAHEDPR